MVVREVVGLDDLDAVEVEPADDTANHDSLRPGRLLHEIATPGRQRLVAEPAHREVELAHDLGRIVGDRDDIAPGDVDVVGEADRHRSPGHGGLQRPVRRLDGGDARPSAARQDEHLVAGCNGAPVTMPAYRRTGRPSWSVRMTSWTATRAPVPPSSMEVTSTSSR